jgi:hypothetical protein
MVKRGYLHTSNRFPTSLYQNRTPSDLCFLTVFSCFVVFYCAEVVLRKWMFSDLARLFCFREFESNEIEEEVWGMGLSVEERGRLDYHSHITAVNRWRLPVIALEIVVELGELKGHQRSLVSELASYFRPRSYDAEVSHRMGSGPQCSV